MLNRRLTAMALALALFLSACGSGSTEEGTPGADDQTDASGDSGDSTGGDASSEDEYVYASPLGEFLGWDTGVNFDEEAAQAEYAEQERKVQEWTATCMREQGFEYQPVDYGQDQYAFDESSLPEEERWGTDAWIEKYGFGITTQRYPQGQVGPDLVGYDDSFWGGPGEDFVDPNQEYVETLLPAEQEAYYAALHGAQDDYPVFAFEEEGREPTDEEMEEMDRYWQEEYVPTGCQNEAWEAVQGNSPFGGPDEEVYQQFDEEFGSLMEEMYERVQASPELIAYRAQVETCVIEKGFDFLIEDEMYMYFEEKMNDAGLGYFDPLEGVDTTNFTDEDFQAAYENVQNQPLPADQLAALAELQAEELGMAIAARDCGGGWENESKISDKIRIELEKQFLAENADRLADYEGVFGQN